MSVPVPESLSRMSKVEVTSRHVRRPCPLTCALRPISKYDYNKSSVIVSVFIGQMSIIWLNHVNLITRNGPSVSLLKRVSLETAHVCSMWTLESAHKQVGQGDTIEGRYMINNNSQS